MTTVKRRFLIAAAVFLGLGALLAFVLFIWQPPCLILRATGFYCVGCGGQRMFSAILQGDLPAAFRWNPFLFCFLPLLIIYMVWEALRFVRGKSPLYKRKPVVTAGSVIAVLALIFTVLRNLPVFAFLAP